MISKTYLPYAVLFYAVCFYPHVLRYKLTGCYLFKLRCLFIELMTLSLTCSSSNQVAINFSTAQSKKQDDVLIRQSRLKGQCSKDSMV